MKKRYLRRAECATAHWKWKPSEGLPNSLVMYTNPSMYRSTPHDNETIVPLSFPRHCILFFNRKPSRYTKPTTPSSHQRNYFLHGVPFVLHMSQWACCASQHFVFYHLRNLPPLEPFCPWHYEIPFADRAFAAPKLFLHASLFQQIWKISRAIFR